MVKDVNKPKSTLFKRKIVRFVLIPFLLLVLWFGFTVSYIMYLDSSFTLISNTLPSTVFTHLPIGTLEKGEYISGKFVGNNNNLGIISLRFKTFFRPAYENEDHLLFQIKEAGDKKWYYQNTYRVGTIYDVPFFPFGFPIITDSKGKIYEFKVTSLNGNGQNSIALSNRWQNVTAKYKFSKQELLQSKTGLLQFCFEKFISSLSTIDVFFSSSVYLLPLFFYLILISPFEKHLAKRAQYLSNSRLLRFLFPSYRANQRNRIFLADIILLGTVLLDGFYLQLGNTFVYILVPILWILTQEHFSFTSRKTILIGIGFLTFPPIFQFIGLNQIAQNMAIWAFLFLFTGTIQSLLVSNKSSKKVDYLSSKSGGNVSKPKTKR
jgi:hypothetical protein